MEIKQYETNKIIITNKIKKQEIIIINRQSYKLTNFNKFK